MPRRRSTSDRYPPRRSHPIPVDDDDDAPRRINPAAVIAITVVIVGGGLLAWLMSGGPTRRPASLTSTPADSGATHPVLTPAVANRPPKAEIRMRVNPRLPTLLEYSGVFSTDPDLRDEDHLTYAWDFGDGTPGISANRGMHTYSRSGTFTIRLVVRDSAGSESSTTQTVTVPPTAHSVAPRPRGDEKPGIEGHWIPLKRSEGFNDIEPRWSEGTALTSAQIHLDGRPRQQWYALRFSGFIEIPEPALWTFILSSDDGSRLVLDGNAIITMDDYQEFRTSGATVEVANPGLVPFRVDYYQGEGGQQLRLEWAGPGVPRQPIPASAFFRSAD